MWYTAMVPLTDDKIFEIRIDRKVESRSGSLEVGVTTADPQTLTSSSEDGGGFPSSANELSQGSSWIMSGNTVRRDGKSVHENYGQLDLDQVNEQVRTIIQIISVLAVVKNMDFMSGFYTQSPI